MQLMLYRAPYMWSPDERRFIFVTGKGGVGKTTVSAAMASALARRGKKVLIAMCNAKERISAMFGSDLVGPDILPVAPSIWAVNIEPERAFEEYGQMTLKVPGLYKVVFQNKIVRSFLPAVPGLSEWAMLGKAWFHTTETDERGRARFDVVILDAPATGHGLDMLRVPRVILDVTPPGILRRDAELAWKMFTDKRATGVVVVTLPQELPATEALELIGSVDHELGLPLGALVINGVVDPLFAPEARAALARSESGDPSRKAGTETDTPAQVAIRAAVARARQEQAQNESLQRLAASTSLDRIVLPFLFEDAARPASIARLAQRL